MMGVAMLAGVLVGRFVLPWVEPRSVHHVSVISAVGKNGCPLAMSETRTLAGNDIGQGEQWFHELGCTEKIDHQSTRIDCRCSP
jgi:hypothetical protein